MNGLASDIKLKHSNVYDPGNLLSTNHSDTFKYSVMILNRPLVHPQKFMVPFWNKASIRIAVDGGTNRWLSFLERNNVTSNVTDIDIISGDFDSILPGIVERFNNGRTRVICTPDQDETDFTKAIKLLSSYCNETNTNLDALFVFCQTSGRIDQLMGNINTMIKCFEQKMLQDVPVYLISDDSISWLLKQGKSTILVPNCSQTNKKSWCALIPVGKKCDEITTTGLKWNLKNGTLEFGKLVSSSNQFDDSGTVTIDTKNVLLWSMSIVPLFTELYGKLNIDDC